MNSRTNDIRKIMDRISELESNELRGRPQALTEGLFDGLKGYLQKRQGKAERGEVVTQIMKGYNIWLGKMDRQGTMDDIEDFMRSELKFSDGELDTILGPNEVGAPSADAEQHAEPAEPETAAQAAEPEAEAEAEDDDQDAGDTTPAGANDDNLEFDSEEGRKLPSDLDTKMSDYGEVGNGAAATGIADDHLKADGSWDEEAIKASLEKLDGEPLELEKGSKTYRFTLNTAGEVTQEPAMAESIMEYGGKLGRSQLKDIFNKAAIELLKKNSSGRGGGQAAGTTQSDAPNGSSAGSQGGSAKAASGDPYDLDRMWEILKAQGMQKGTVTKLMNKVRGSNSVATLTDQELQDLGIIGFAFLKSGL